MIVKEIKPDPEMQIRLQQAVERAENTVEWSLVFLKAAIVGNIAALVLLFTGADNFRASIMVFAFAFVISRIGFILRYLAAKRLESAIEKEMVARVIND